MQYLEVIFFKDYFKIPLIAGSTYNDLKLAYTGGMVDVYKPRNIKGTKVNIYDVNSLYPSSMEQFAMPVGTPVYFEGDISKIDSRAFGVFEAEIIAPNNFNYPILQTKVNTLNGNKTLTPLGNWTGWYLSEELYNAMKYGYKIKINKGYLFEKGFIFKDFVKFLYELKANSEKNSPIYSIAKLTLNSLYGKFGTEPEMDRHLIIDSSKSDEYYKKYIVTNTIDLLNGKELISFFKEKSLFTESNKPSSINTSISIALATTAYGRIHMSNLKQMILALGLIIYYMDTDSLAVSG